MTPTVRRRIRPSKPGAILGSAIGVAIIVIVLTGGPSKQIGLTIFFCVGAVAAIAFNLWAAFSPRGSVYTIDDDR
jgi:hypothetical protein